MASTDHYSGGPGKPHTTYRKRYSGKNIKINGELIIQRKVTVVAPYPLPPPPPFLKKIKGGVGRKNKERREIYKDAVVARRSLKTWREGDRETTQHQKNWEATNKRGKKERKKRAVIFAPVVLRTPPPAVRALMNLSGTAGGSEH